MKRKNFLAALFAAPLALAQRRTQQKGTTYIDPAVDPPPPGPKQKYYITGFLHAPTANDCTIPPIEAVGTDRLNALLRCCESGSITIWTEAEWLEFRRKMGTEFDESCKAIQIQRGIK